VLTYDAAKKKYLLSATKPGDAENALEFEGKRTKSGVLFERVKKGKAKDELDKLEFKILNEGDRIVYNVQKRIGTGKAYKQVAQIGLNRQGTSIAAKEGNGPKCIVTGGAAAMTVSYEGQSYYVCCSGCREAFLANPAKYVAKAKKGD
jgi:YHS domain-containing protein